MTNINKELFRRTQPARKLEIIEGLTTSELLDISIETIDRIIREAGSGKRGHKSFYLPTSMQTGNCWNSTIEGWYISCKKIYVSIYLQYANTDTSTCDLARTFLKCGSYQGSVERDDRYGNPRHYYFTYDEQDKARAIRALLKEYVERKYASKLKKP